MEEASNRAAEHVFGTNHSSGRARGRAAAQMTKDHVAENEQAYSEGRRYFLFMLIEILLCITPQVILVL